MRQDRVGALAASFYSLRVVRVGIARHVNVASMAPRATPSTRCPTQHYKGLVKLNQAYGARGLQILAFPCNQFLKQESGTSEEILAGARGRGVGLDLDRHSQVEKGGVSFDHRVPEDQRAFTFVAVPAWA